MRIYKNILLSWIISFIIICEFPLSSNQAEARARPYGALNVLVLMVDFSDKPGQVQRTYFEELMFGTKPSVAPLGSFADYYNEVSYGQLSITGRVNNGTINWYRMPQTYAYYVNNQYGLGEYPQNVQRLVEDAVNAAKASGLDFGPFDNDNDGYVDALFVIHAGQGAEITECTCDILTHHKPFEVALSIDTGSVNAEGEKVYVRDYTIQPEYINSPNDMTIGAFAHEFAHLLGLPDLYDRDDTSQGLGSWSLMAVGAWNGPNDLGDSPAHADAWSKVKLGWAAPSMSSCPLIQIPQVETNPVIYKFVTSRPEEYFLAENRQKVGFDKYLPGEGLAIYHVDESITTQNDMEWYPGCTTCTSHYLVALEQADGQWDLEKNNNAGDKGDLYPYRRNKAFTSASTPNSNDYAGNKTDVSITRISASKATMSARIDVQKTSGIPIAVAPFHQMFPQVASDGTNSLVVWSDSDYTDRSTKIYGVLVGQPGGLVGECRFFIAEGSWPSVAFDGKNYLVVYTNIDGDIYGTRVTPFGRVLDRRGFPISTTVGDWEFAPRIAFNGTIYLVVWNRYLSIPATFNVFGARVRPDGVVLDPQGIDIFPSIDGEFYPDVASDGANFLVVAGDSTFTPPWIYHVYGARISPDGILQDPNGIVIATTGINDQSVAFDGTNYVVVWTDIRNSPELGESNWDIYGNRVTPDGTVIDPGGIAISTALRNQDTPSIMFRPYMYLVAWRDARISPWDSHLYGARISAFAIVMDPDGVPISTAVNEQGFLDITFDGSNFLVVWEDARNQSDGGNYDAYGARVSTDGTLLDP